MSSQQKIQMQQSNENENFESQLLKNSPFEVNENSENRYYRGFLNFLIRLYYYLQEGLNQVNSFKNVILGVAALALMMRIEQDYVKIGLMGLATLPIITWVGWAWTARAKKSTEYFTLKYTTVFGKYGIQMSEENLKQKGRIIKLLTEISEKLDKK